MNSYVPLLLLGTVAFYKASRLLSDTTTSQQSSLIVYEYNNKRILAKRNTCYTTAIRECRQLFSVISANQKVTFHTEELNICSGLLTEISEDVWAGVVGNLTSVIVKTEDRLQGSQGVAERDQDTTNLELLNLTVYFKGRKYAFRALSDSKLELLHLAAARRLGENPEDWFLSFHGRDCPENATLESLGIQDGDTLVLMPTLLGKKPVIYIFSPEARDVDVKLSLIPHWKLSAIYPIVPIKPRTPYSNEQVVWRVRTHGNGDLTELTTGLDIAYLFWEARTDATALASQPLSPHLGGSNEGLADYFNPNEAALNDKNSVVTPVTKITPYLDKVLAGLGLHTEARTSFITYWLPSILKHQRIALRFLPQASYEQAAPLEISPPPHVITRVFMVFRGVDNVELQNWTVASRTVSEDVAHWQKVVGVNPERALDANLYRVLEWGGMEVRLGS